MLVVVGPEALVGVGRHEIRGEVQVHELGGEARRRPELGQLLPRAGAVARLLLELAPRGELGVLRRARRGVTVERPGRDLEQDPPGGRPPLSDEEDAVGGVDRDDGDRSRMARDVPLRTGAVGPLDRVDPELEVAAAVQDAGIDDPLDELLVGRAGIERRLAIRRRGGVARAGGAGPGRPVGQAATASRSEVRLAPDSASNRCSLL